jgi:antitoxin MazE
LDILRIDYVLTLSQEVPIMIKTLTRHGNSYALVIDKPILDLLRASPDTPFQIMTDGNSLILTPMREAEEERKFQDALAMVHTRFGKAMKKLAE